MLYHSTRGQSRLHTFTEAVEAGLAPDGGLFLPETLPSIADKLGAWAALSYAELAAEFLSLFAPEIPLDEWHSLTKQASSA
jgi:threonine synthase